jgi:hypothetical protein
MPILKTTHPSKKLLLGLLLILTVLLGVQVVDPARANFVPQDPIPPIMVTVSSPINGSIYTGNLVRLEFDIQTFPWGVDEAPGFFYASCWLDDKIVSDSTHSDFDNIILTNLSEGLHYVKVDARGTYFYWKDYPVNGTSGKIYFTINPATQSTPEPTMEAVPEVVLLGIPNLTSTTSELAFNFTINKSAQWLGYSLDEKANVTISNSSNPLLSPDLYQQTLTDLQEGQHTIVFYAQDKNGNFGASEKATFTVTLSKPTDTPTLTTSLMETTQPANSPYPTQTKEESISLPEMFVAFLGAGLIISVASLTGVYLYRKNMQRRS